MLKLFHTNKDSSLNWNVFTEIQTSSKQQILDLMVPSKPRRVVGHVADPLGYFRFNHYISP